MCISARILYIRGFGGSVAIFVAFQLALFSASQWPEISFYVSIHDTRILLTDGIEPTISKKIFTGQYNH